MCKKDNRKKKQKKTRLEEAKIVVIKKASPREFFSTKYCFWGINCPNGTSLQVEYEGNKDDLIVSTWHGGSKP